MKDFFKKIIVAAVILPAAFSAQAKEGHNIVINEISWMGTLESHANEWIELYNPNDFDIMLDDWILKTESESINITLKGIIKKKDFFILERTSEETLSEIKSDLIYKGALNNKGDSLFLYNNEGILIDKVECSHGWFSGDNETKETMERISPFELDNLSQNWQNGPVEGSPRKENIVKKENKKTYFINEKKNISPFVPAIIISFLSSFLVITLKKKLKKMYNT